ncbi:MAG: prephenate dehydrogenase/arogenate dehydrogenase family protein [Candidatus Omnitrophota bacterium]
MSIINKVTIVGVGLIGGSIGLAVKKKKLAKEVVGVFRRRSSITKALRVRAVDRGTLDLADGARGADLVIIATPVGMIPVMAKAAAKHLKRGAIITDVGSVKGPICRVIERAIGAGISFVGGHPMAGSEKSGPEFGEAGLFEGSVCILTRTSRTRAGALRVIARFWRSVGADVSVMDPDLHDTIVAGVSHLPHIVAQTLCLSVGRESLKYASGSFRDTTRVASLNAGVWLDIFSANRKNVVKEIDRFSAVLKKIRRDLARGDYIRLKRTIDAATLVREKYLKAE